MNVFRAVALDNGVTMIKLVQTDESEPGYEPVSNYLGQSTVFLDGDAADLQADEPGIAFAETLARTALDLLRDLDFTAHPDIAEIQIPDNLPFLKFSRKAGCACGCSPGVLTFTRLWAKTRDDTLFRVDVHVTVGWDSNI